MIMTGKMVEWTFIDDSGQKRIFKGRVVSEVPRGCIQVMVGDEIVSVEKEKVKGARGRPPKGM